MRTATLIVAAVSGLALAAPAEAQQTRGANYPAPAAMVPAAPVTVVPATAGYHTSTAGPFARCKVVTPTGLGPASLYMVDNWAGESVVVVATAVVVVAGAVVAGAVLVGARVLGAAVLLEQAASMPATDRTRASLDTEIFITLIP